MSAGRLIVCPTPIGNAGDITQRAVKALRDADLVACEDTRRTGALLAALGIEKRKLLSLHEHNEAARVAQVLERIEAGESVVLVSDAGTPGVSDPGYPLISAAIERGAALTVLPGASSVLTAVVASGLPLDRWRFAGFLPRTANGIEAELGRAPGEPLVAFESPRRLLKTLRAIAAHDPQRPLAVCRELTKTHEEIVRGSAEHVQRHFEEHEPLGEIVLVIGAADAATSDLTAALEALGRLVHAGAKPRAAAAVVADLSGVAKNALYEAWLER